MAEQKLTTKQLKFIEEYGKDSNATQAAIRAGYSSKNAYCIGYENLNKPYIKDVIEERQKQLSHSNGITAEFVLNGIMEVAMRKGIKENDTLKAYELLGKYMKLFTERIEEKSDQTVTIKLEGEASDWAK